jgi:XRE family transcriptional regulator, aerobic/anaerobic benzoate catabolism transcriptional regulator
MNAPLTSEAQETLYLARLGERVRAWRADRGMTRRALAAASGVSERYLAQLEAGRGNISVLLLRRVARAMNVPVEHLVREEESAHAARVALVGLRGAGKSTLGQMLAQHLGCPFIELDRVIEQEYGATVSFLIEMAGLATFRRYERACLERVIAEHEAAVIATAGGIVSDPETYALLLRRTFSIWLKARPDEHMSRVIEQGDFRPMAQNRVSMADLVAIL